MQCLASFAAFFAAVSVLHAQTAEIVVVNQTGASIFLLYVSPSSSDSWGEDVLGRQVLPDGSVFRVRLSPADERYDIRAVDAASNEYLIWGWVRGADARVSLTREAYVGQGTAALRSRAISRVTIVNETGYTVRAVHVRPVGADGWELADQYLPDGQVMHFREVMTITIDTDRYETLLFDAMLVDEDGDRYIMTGIELEGSGELVFTLENMVR